MTVGDELATTADADAVALCRVPSDATSSTETVCPLSPLPATERSNEDDALGPLVVARTTESTLHVNVYVSASPSASDDVAVALMTWFVVGDVMSIATPVVGAASATTTDAVAGALVVCPSEAVTRTAIVSPRSPCPAIERSSDGPVAPTSNVPFRSHS